MGEEKRIVQEKSFKNKNKFKPLYTMQSERKDPKLINDCVTNTDSTQEIIAKFL